MQPDQGPAIEAHGLVRIYGGAEHSFSAVVDVSLTVDRGEVVAVVGPSGSGKSTLLYLLGGLDVPDAGSVRLAGVDWTTLSGAARAHFRRQTCTFVVQGFGLLPQATAAENIEVPLILERLSQAERSRRVGDILERLGLAEHAHQLPDQLSGGEKQRVAVARALVLEPAVVLADEPTGSLDSRTAQTVARLLIGAAQDRGAAVVMVTHDPAIARHAHRTVTMHSGQLQ
jgi:ABC-type lipoprotein export system ATPase subunit